MILLLQYLHIRFSAKAFGERSARVDLTKMQAEVAEAIDDPCKEEFADILLCFLNAIKLADVSWYAVVVQAYRKYNINRKRERN